jgi:acylphosphatase
MKGMIKHFNISIDGLVHGVFFRTSAKQKADYLNLKGFAQNEPDGSVYLEVEGEEENLEKFLTWCRKGPPLAKVERVEVTKGLVKGYSDFVII